MVHLDQKTLREVHLSDVRADLNRKVVKRSGDGPRSTSKWDNSEERVDVTSALVDEVTKEANNPNLSVGEELDTR